MHFRAFFQACFQLHVLERFLARFRAPYFENIDGIRNLTRLFLSIAVFSPDDAQLNFQRLGKMGGIDDISFPPSSHFINLLMPSTPVAVPAQTQQQQQQPQIFLPSSHNVATVVSPTPGNQQSLSHGSLLESKTYFEFSEPNCFLPSQISNASFASSDYHQVALVYKNHSVSPSADIPIIQYYVARSLPRPRSISRDSIAG